MRNKDYYVTSVIVFAIFIILPIALHIVIVCKFPVSTTGAAWIGFWGSYLGGLVTFLCLLITIAINKHNLSLEHERAKIESIKKDLSRRIESLNVSESLEKPVAYMNSLTIEELEYDLLKLSNRYNSLTHSAELLYNTPNSSQSSKNFFNKYSLCLNVCNISIPKILDAIKSDDPKKDLKELIYKAIFIDSQNYKEAKDAAMALIKEHEELFDAKMKMSTSEIIQTYFKKQ